MGYIALYRKYRPLTFSDVVGQENVTGILKSQIIKNKISHAYIFSGTRGTGKTSSAKIFARAINCENPEGGEPCNKCKTCLSILSGENTDVIEMDAASNNSVENIRQIRNEVTYASTSCKYKVYIIDEVHMLTTSAFNALLKTLEEPPENVVFILATTEQHKIPVTILSRCLRFDFLRISTESIKNRVEYVLKEENVEYEEEAVKYIAKLAEGALRDALSLLDRCLSENSEKLTLEAVRNIIGTIDSEKIVGLASAIIDSNYEEVLNIVDEMQNKGKDLRQLVYELTEYFLELLIKSEDKDRLAYIIDELGKLDSDIRMSINPVIIVKATLIKLAKKREIVSGGNANVGNSDSSEKLFNIEQDIIKIKNYLNSQRMNFGTVRQNVEQRNASNSVDSKVYQNADEFRKRLTARRKLKLFSALSGAIIKNEDTFTIITTNEFAAKMLASQKDEIEQFIKTEYEIDKNVVIKYNKVDSNMSKMEKLLKDSGTNYTDIE